MESAAISSKTRAANWDLLRALSMFCVVVVHTTNIFPSLFENFNVGYGLNRVAIICDPTFFMLSGFFALRPLKGSLKQYYLKKVSGVVLPIVIYSIIVYLITSWKAPLSLGGYLMSFSQLLHGGWWFIPALISYLMLAPFLFRALEALDDNHILLLFKVLTFIYMWGVIFHIGLYTADLLNRPGIKNLLDIASCLVPRMLPTGYFMVFSMGYLYRRLSLILSDSWKQSIRFIGIFAIALCFFFSGIGIGGDDPDQLWVIVSFALFFIFERVNLHRTTLKNIVIWIAKRSYTIYLFQYLTIEFMTNQIYGHQLFGDTSTLSLPVNVLIWLALTLSSYLLALCIASILDSFVLNPMQKAFNNVFLRKA